MTAGGTPDAETLITAELVESLLNDQMPEFEGLQLTELASGWDNMVFRLGDRYTVRVPRREAAANLVFTEHRWLPTLASNVVLPMSSPIRLGHPSATYPWNWTVCRWIDGISALTAPIHDHAHAAATLGEFVSDFHTPAPIDAPRNPYRGIPLRERAHLTDAHLNAVAEVAGPYGAAVDSDAVMAVWTDALAAGEWNGPPVWLHGDLHPDNILVDQGEISGVIDFGDLCAGDPACDLAIGWMLFDHDARSTFRIHAGAEDDDATWRRARGWAVAFGLVLLAHSADRPEYTALAHRTLRRIAE